MRSDRRATIADPTGSTAALESNYAGSAAPEFPARTALIRLAASVVIEQNDEWLVGRRYLSNHSLDAVLDKRKNKTQTERRPASSPRPEQPTILPTRYTTSWDLTSLRGLLDQLTSEGRSGAGRLTRGYLSDVFAPYARTERWGGEGAEDLQIRPPGERRRSTLTGRGFVLRQRQHGTAGSTGSGGNGRVTTVVFKGRTGYSMIVPSSLPVAPLRALRHPPPPPEPPATVEYPSSLA